MLRCRTPASSTRVLGRPVRTRAQARAGASRDDADFRYPQWLALPLQPGELRRTSRTDLGGGTWLFEQSLGVLDVLVNVRMTVLRLRDGSLFVHAPIAPTPECLRLLRELGAPVRYIVLPTSAVEHKARGAAASSSFSLKAHHPYRCFWGPLRAASRTRRCMRRRGSGAGR